MTSPLYLNATRGQGWARYAHALLKAPNDLPSALGFARAAYGENSSVVACLRAAVSSGTTTDASWMGGFSEYHTLVNEFIALLQPRSVVGQLQPTLRVVPLNTRIWRQLDSAMSAYWTGQGAAKPLSSGAFDSIELPPLKVSALAVITKELRDLPPAKAESIILQTMTVALTKAIDEKFISDDAAVSGVSPPGILAGIAPIASSGDASTDVSALLESFEGDLATSYFICRPSTAAQLALHGASTSNVFADVSARGGGSLLGIPVIVSKYVGAGSSSPSSLILIDAAQVLLGTGDVGIAAAGSASLEMLDNPVGNSTTATSTSLVSLYQTDSVALRCERQISWALTRSDACAWVENANYSGT